MRLVYAGQVPTATNETIAAMFIDAESRHNYMAFKFCKNGCTYGTITVLDKSHNVVNVPRDVSKYVSNKINQLKVMTVK